jgi:hypothetical protein
LRDDLNDLKRDIEDTLDMIECAMDQVKAEADKMGIGVHLLRTSDGRWAMHELIMAKAQAYNAYATVTSLLNRKDD